MGLAVTSNASDYESVSTLGRLLFLSLLILLCPWIIIGTCYVFVNRYEPHLWENERRYYQRCAVLFGSLIQLNRLYTDTVLKLPSHADTNTLNMTGTVPRFTYLPIRWACYDKVELTRCVYVGSSWPPSIFLVFTLLVRFAHIVHYAVFEVYCNSDRICRFGYRAGILSIQSDFHHTCLV